LTGNAVAVGSMVVLAGVPRIAFMLVGGALSDRFSGRALMLGANLVRTLLLALLAWLVLTGQVELWMLAGFSLAYGLVEAFFSPARSAIVPLLVRGEELQAANSLAVGLEQVCGLVGPLLAGLAIAWLDPGRELGLLGVGIAFAVSALATLGSVVSLGLMAPRRPASAKAAEAQTGLASSVKQVVAYVWSHKLLRVLMAIIVAINLLTTWPLWVGLPMLAGTRLAGGAAALGLLTSALGGGALLGTGLAGALPKPAAGSLGTLFWLTLGVVAGGLAALVTTTWLPVAALAALAVSAAASYINVTLVTWLQSQTPQALMGRVMSLVALK
jgi:MFS family permease